MTKNERKQYNKIYHLANKEQRREYRQINKEKIKAQVEDYYQANRQKLSVQHKEYYQANKKQILAQRKDYRQTNKEQINKYQNDKRNTSLAFKLIANLRNRHGSVLKGICSTTKGLGCDSNFLREYIENQWIEGMTWNNYGNKKGQWSIDHIVPLSIYHTQPELLPKLIHYSNMQPMWHVENVKKGNKVAKLIT